ncbi:MAG: hypothetical protein K9L89_00750 [Kiritimatiellales bacterium]|nr:hypothetical protein [Kiritimatiellales bacterium]
MNLLSSILFWAGIVVLIDGSLGLLLLDKWQKLVSGLNIRRIALVEIGVALGMLAAHYLLGQIAN